MTIADQPEVWAITDHICAHCLGRVLVANISRQGRAYRCADCGAVGSGKPGLAHPPMCVCGSRIGERNAGIRCTPNDDQSSARPWEIVAREVKTGAERQKGAAKRRRPSICDSTESLPLN